MNSSSFNVAPVSGPAVARVSKPAPAMPMAQLHPVTVRVVGASRRNFSMLVCALAAALALLAPSIVTAQHDDGPILLPKPKPRPAQGTLLVLCDLPCNWKLDRKPRGAIAAGDSATATLTPGQHLVTAATLDGLDAVENEVEVKAGQQTIARLALQPVRDARLKTIEPPRPQPAPAINGSVTVAEHAQRGFDLFTQKNYQGARPELEAACNGDQMAACVYLGTLYQVGRGVVQDFVQATTLYRKACDGGEVTGCKSLGFLYESGQGVTQNYAKAATLYHKACDGGEMTGCTNLGILYDNGRGVVQDRAQAASLYRKACNGGEGFGCTNLGFLYASGEGVTRDLEQARAFYKKACDGGLQLACDNLRTLP